MAYESDEAWTNAPGVLESIWRYKLWIVTAALVGALGGYYLALQQPVAYQTSGVLVLIPADRRGVFGPSTGNIEDANFFLASQEGDLASSQLVRQRAADLLGDITAEDLADAVTVTTDAALLTITITATAPTPERVVAIVDAMSQAYRDVVSEQIASDAERITAELSTAIESVQARIDEMTALVEPVVTADGETQTTGDPVAEARMSNLATQLLTLESRVQEVRVDAALVGNGVDRYEQPSVPEEPVIPNPEQYAILLGLLFAGLAAAAAYRRSGARMVIEEPLAAAGILNAPLFGQVPPPRSKGGGTVPAVLGSDPATREAYQFAVSSLEFALSKVNGWTVLITSAAPDEPATDASLHLAVASARDGRKVLLVDGDLRARTLSDAVGVGDVPGLSDVVAGTAELDGVVHRVARPELPLEIVPAGGGDQAAHTFLRSVPFRSTMDEIRQRLEFVIIDTAPILSVADTSVIAGQVDGIVVLVPEGISVTRLEQLRQRLLFVPAPLLGYLYVTAHGPDTIYAPPRRSGRRQQGQVGLARPADQQPPAGAIRGG